MLNRLSSSFHIPQFTIKFFFSGPNELLAAGDFLIANLSAPHKKLLEPAGSVAREISNESCVPWTLVVVLLRRASRKALAVGFNYP